MHFEQLVMSLLHAAQRYSWRNLLLLLIFMNFFAIIVMFFSLERRCTADAPLDVPEPPAKVNKARLFERAFDLPNNMVTAIFREFEPYEHDLEETLLSFNSVFSRMRILVVSDDALYPPLQQIPQTVESVRLQKYISDFSNNSLADYIRNQFVLLAPDNVRLTQPVILTEMVKFLINNPDQLVAVPVGDVDCLQLRVEPRLWSLSYKTLPKSSSLCDAISGEHAVLLPSKLLLSLPFALERPLPDSLYIQTTLRGIKTRIIQDVHLSKPLKRLFGNEHLREKKVRYYSFHKQMLYQKFGVKKVTREDKIVEWYGCHKNSERCFGTVINETPDYLFKKRWTPPCCLENLRVTARHTFKVLEEFQVRYWLEGGSLLGAARAGDIIPWDYDVDIGIYEEDLPRCPWLKLAKENKRPVDPQGFIWEKATEGSFYRVQFSAKNRLHVDIFPFRSKGGTMTKDTWFETHRQDREFPESYLKPLTRIPFAGVHASAPNNVTGFLEYKFGKGVITKKQYPNPEVLTYDEA
ncbi:fukutin-related protein [Galendromus occidentalis]|uniref:Fukutin-related protein n=1 Tax=Galendromus occidentalis TaxID=34638 RepID=A0AAJ6VVL1_9ACAR|nr:fukutin-related protein [Galendromus occidentalis]